MEILGKSPIPLPILILGKLAMFLSWMFFLVEMFDLDAMLFDSAATSVLGVVFAVAGLAIAGAGLMTLGESARVGFPTGKTELRTQGVFRFTRNPAYLGGFLVCIGSCLFAPHILNFLLFMITLVIHHCIVLREEAFLETTFGEKWLEYKERVPRYIGRVKPGAC